VRSLRIPGHWLLSFVVLICGLGTVQRALELVRLLRSGQAIPLSATKSTLSWWLPLSSFAVAATALVVAYSILRMWRKSWLLLGLFWCLFALFVAFVNLAADRAMTVRLAIYGIGLLATMVFTTISLRRYVASHAP